MRGGVHDGHHLVQMIHDNGRSLASGDDPARAADNAISCCTCAPPQPPAKQAVIVQRLELLDQRADSGPIREPHDHSLQVMTDDDRGATVTMQLPNAGLRSNGKERFAEQHPDEWSNGGFTTQAAWPPDTTTGLTVHAL